MENIIKKGLLCARLPTLQTVRYRGKINLRNPRPPCYEKARIIAATKALMPKPTYNATCLVDPYKKKEVENPYERILAREIRNWFESSKVIAFFHVNPINSEDFFNARVAFHKQGMTLKKYNKNLVEKAIGETRLSPALSLFGLETAVVFSAEDKVQQIVKITKKIPQIILIAGIAEDRFLSKIEFENLAIMPDLQTCRAQFAATLDSIGNHLVSNLQAHQTQLATLLDMHAKSADTTSPAPETGEKEGA